MTTIRRHTRDDIEAIIALAEHLADPKRAAFVAEPPGAPVGYAMAELFDNHTAMWSPEKTTKRRRSAVSLTAKGG